MSGSFVPHMGLLPQPQRGLWPELRSVSALGLVLYGGTAIALRLGHRLSADFDFFTDKPLSKSAIQKALRFIERSVMIQDQPDTFTVLVPDAIATDSHIKVSFFGNISFGRIGEPQWTEDGVLQVASLGVTQVVADAAITPGGCRVDTEFGSLDQQIEAQLNRITSELT